MLLIYLISTVGGERRSFNIFIGISISAVVLSVLIIMQSATNPIFYQVVMYVIAIYFVVLFASLPSGLILYWVVQNILQIFQQLYINKTI